MIFFKDSIAQINYMGMEYSIGSNFLEDMEFSKYNILRNSIGHFFTIGMEYSMRQFY